MPVALLESIPHTDAVAVRSHFHRYGTVNIGGLVAPELFEDAIHDARELASPLQTTNRSRETVAHLRIPDSKKEKALCAVLRGIREGAVLLGHDTEPVSGEEEYLIKLLEREQPGSLAQYTATPTGVVATTNLRGRSYRRIIGMDDGEEADYSIDRGDTIFHQLGRGLAFRDYPGFEGGRIALEVAKKPHNY